MLFPLLSSPLLSSPLLSSPLLSSSSLSSNPHAIATSGGALHILAHRNDIAAVKWLLAHGAQINGRWNSGGAEVTPLHLAAARGHVEMARLLLEAGADPSIRDSMHDSDPLGWAEYFQQPETVALLRPDE